VDGKTYTYKIPEGSYDTAEELVDALNKVITDAADDSCLKVSLSGNMLKFAYNKLGVHTIENIQGPAKTALFYQTMGRFDQEVDGWLQIGANGQQGVELKRYSMSTMSLGVNSLSVSKHKYADKALERIDEALNYLSSVRSKYGALENRLEYAVRVDDIAAENTQNSESIDRDADMASEMVEYSKSQQAGVSILSQTNRNTQSILSLLK
jgi:flagellin-like hook-associated protein FlgL